MISRQLERARLSLVPRLDRAVFAVFAVAFLVRVVYILTVGVGYAPHFDAGVYDGLARALLKQHCFCYAPHAPTAFRPPLWPMVIAGIYAVTGMSVQAVQFCCAVLGAGTCALLYLFARDLFGRRIALLVGMAAAVYAGMFIWDGWLFAESLFIFLQMVFLLALLRLQRTRRRRWAAISGGALGLSALARPNGAALLALVVLWAGIVLVTQVLPWRVLAPCLALLAVVGLAVVLPWSIRDTVVTGSVLPISTVGTTLAGAYNDMVDQPDSGLYGLWWLPPSDNADIHPHTAADELALEQTALAWIGTNPVSTRTLLGVHFQHMWVPYLYTWTDLPFEEFPARPASQVVMQLIPWMSYPVFALAGLGLLLTWRERRKELASVYLLLAITVGENVVFYGSPRFRAPIEPFLVLLAGGAVWWITRRASFANAAQSVSEAFVVTRERLSAPKVSAAPQRTTRPQISTRRAAPTASQARGGIQARRVTQARRGIQARRTGRPAHAPSSSRTSTQVRPSTRTRTRPSASARHPEAQARQPVAGQHSGRATQP